MIHACDSEEVIFCSGVRKSASVILPFLQDKVNRNAWMPYAKVSLRCAQLGRQAAILGAISLLQGQAD